MRWRIASPASTRVQTIISSSRTPWENSWPACGRCCGVRRGCCRRVLRVADLALDTNTRVARRGAREIPLTTKEFAVLEVLMRHPGAVLTRERISAHAWDDNYDPLSNVIDVYVGRLRRKIDQGEEPPLVETVRGAGYRIGAP
jgi:DNA-binding response OmpR family regulator